MHVAFAPPPAPLGVSQYHVRQSDPRRTPMRSYRRHQHHPAPRRNVSVTGASVSLGLGLGRRAGPKKSLILSHWEQPYSRARQSHVVLALCWVPMYWYAEREEGYEWVRNSPMGALTPASRHIPDRLCAWRSYVNTYSSLGCHLVWTADFWEQTTD